MAAEKIYRIVGDLEVSPSVSEIEVSEIEVSEIEVSEIEVSEIEVSEIEVSEIEVALLVLRVVKAVGSSRANEARPDFSSGLLSRKLRVVAKLVE